MQIDYVFFRKIIDFTCVYTIFLLPLPRIYEPRSKGRNSKGILYIALWRFLLFMRRRLLCGGRE